MAEINTFEMYNIILFFFSVKWFAIVKHLITELVRKQKPHD